MKKRHNPFQIREIPVDGQFCNRQKELSDLMSYAAAGAAVVVYSPRRYGKTSLIRRVQAQLAKQGSLTLFCDFFGVTTADDIAHRLARSVFDLTHSREPLFTKAIRLFSGFRPVLKPDESGTFSLTVETVGRKAEPLERLEDTLRALETFTSDGETRVNVALDEFQEITEVGDAIRIEGLLRQYVQKIRCSFFFIGSRRRILLDMFNQRQRPFYQSAINMTLPPLPPAEFGPFLASLFQKAGMKCSETDGLRLASLTHGHPYYTQKLCFFLYEKEAEKVDDSLIHAAFEDLISNETPVFEAMVQGLAPRQIALARALGSEETTSVFAADFMARHDLGSTGGIQGALKKLTRLDIIERLPDGQWKVTDPVFKRWLVHQAR